MITRLSKWCLIALAGVFVVSARVSVQAQVPFFESFDNPAPPDGRILFTADAIYDGIPGPETGGTLAGNTFENGRIVQSLETAILGDRSGSGFFLHNRTGGGGGPFIGEVWGTTSPLSVVPGNTYEFAFYLTNENTINSARIQPTINGVSVGSPVSAVGTFLTNGWQRFSISWNSGAATTADLRLMNVQPQPDGFGNDFGIDDISFIPEPSGFVLIVFGAFILGLGLPVWRGRRRSTGQSSRL